MPIQFDWEFTDAPDKDERAKAAQAAQRPPPLPAAPLTPRASAPARRWPWWWYVGLAVGVLVLSALGVWGGFAYWRWTEFQADVILLVQNEEQASLQGNSDQVARLQDASDPAWAQLRAEQAQNYLPAPLPVPTLNLVGDQIALSATRLWAEDLIEADVERHYTTPDGRTVYFSLPQFYRHKQGSWQHTLPPGNLWGTLEKWESPHLVIRYYAVDEGVVRSLAPEVEGLLAQACSFATRVCAQPARLYLSASLVALGYEPLRNVEVNLNLPEETDSNVFYVSLPSPHLAGMPTDATATELLVKYYTLRLWVARALAVNEDASIAQVVDTLDLEAVDPGFVALHSPLTGSTETTQRPTPTPAPTATIVSIAFLEHIVQEGETLVGIATTYGVTVDVLVRANHLTDPDLLSIGQVLLVPQGAYP